MGHSALRRCAARLVWWMPRKGLLRKNISDVASLNGANSQNLSFYSGSSRLSAALTHSQAGFCFLTAELLPFAPAGMTALITPDPVRAFIAVTALFYPRWHEIGQSAPDAVDSSARIEPGVRLSPGVVIGANAEIGSGTVLGPNTVIGRGVAIGKNCRIAGNSVISHSYLGDSVVIHAGAQIGQPGFGFHSSAAGHNPVPQIGRVIIQDNVEIGAGTAIDRGALSDTVIGEGTKIDNLVQIGHNSHIGRRCIIVSQVGISGSCEIGDYVVLGGQVGIADHVVIGDGARLAARCAVTSGTKLAGHADYGGVPAKPVKDWAREVATLTKLTKDRRKPVNG